MPTPMRPWVDRLLACGQAAMLLVAIVGGVAWMTRWAEHKHRAFEVQIDRLEAKIDDKIARDDARDRAWAKAVGLPMPPWADEPE